MVGWLVCQVSTAQTFNTQPGSLVTQAGDTLRGIIKDRSDVSEQVLFQAEGSSDFKKFTPEEAKSFRVDGGYYYKAMPVPNEDKTTRALFLLCLLEGEIGLYQRQNDLYVEKPANTLYKLEEERTRIKGNQFRVKRKYVNTLSYLMADCPSVQPAIERARLNPITMIKLITQYQQCINPTEEEKRTIEPTKIAIRLGVRAGGMSSRIIMLLRGNRVLNYEFGELNNVVGGIVADFSYKNKVSARPELLITRRGGVSERPYNTLQTEQVQISLTSLQLPVSIYYTLPTHHLRPFVRGGGSFSHTIVDKSYSQILNTDTREAIRNERSIPTDNDQFGYHFGGGVSYTMPGGGRVGLEYVYERSFTNGIRSDVQVHFAAQRITATYLLPPKKK